MGNPYPRNLVEYQVQQRVLDVLRHNLNVVDVDVHYNVQNVYKTIDWKKEKKLEKVRKIVCKKEKEKRNQK